jgi:hypothetical protein
MLMYVLGEVAVAGMWIYELVGVAAEDVRVETLVKEDLPLADVAVFTDSRWDDLTPAAFAAVGATSASIAPAVMTDLRKLILISLALSAALCDRWGEDP